MAGRQATFPRLSKVFCSSTAAVLVSSNYNKRLVLCVLTHYPDDGNTLDPTGIDFFPFDFHGHLDQSDAALLLDGSMGRNSGHKLL